MRTMFSRVLLVSVVLSIALMQRIPTGVWGGQHIHIEVGETSATIEYDCANGVIDGPLILDANGNFKLSGTHRIERGGRGELDITSAGRARLDLPAGTGAL